MRIKVDERLYAQAFDILGRAGEREYREISCEYPQVEGAQTYKLRFELADKGCYDLDITQGNVAVPYSLLTSAGFVKVQFIATAADDHGNYKIIAKSNVFYCVVGPSINAEIEPIPTYEEAQNALERILDALRDYEAKTKILTQAQYLSMSVHDPKTVYYVTQDGKVSAYLGDDLIAGGDASVYDVPKLASYKHKGRIDIFGKIESEE